MSLLYTGSWDHALLAATVKAASDAGATGYLGRTAIQKIVYFLQVSGVPMRYSFDIYHYGPYCDRISKDVEWLLADSVLKDGSPDSGKYSNYKPATALDDLLQLHPDINLHLQTITSVVKTLLPLKPDRLELLATLDYLYRQIKAGGGGGPWKQRVVDKFVEVKKDKFSRDDVTAAYDSMVKIQLISE